MLLVLGSVTPPLVRLVAGLGNAVAELRLGPESFPNVFITHAYDGEHKPGSLHKKYAALDIRVHNLNREERSVLLAKLRAKFPTPRFDVLYEAPDTPNEHIHIEDNQPWTPDPEVIHAPIPT